MEIPDALFEEKDQSQKVASDERSKIEEVLGGKVASASEAALKDKLAEGHDVNADADMAFHRSLLHGDTVKSAGERLAHQYGEEVANKVLADVSGCAMGMGIVYANAKHFTNENELSKYANENPHVGVLVMSDLPKTAFWSRANPMKVVPGELFGMKVIASEEVLCDNVSELVFDKLAASGKIDTDTAEAFKNAGALNHENISDLETAVKGAGNKEAFSIQSAYADSDYVSGTEMGESFTDMGVSQTSEDLSVMDINLDNTFAPVPE
jgi:hypothetical protein